MKFNVEQYVVGPIATNCYFLINEDEKKVVVIDPGAAAEPLYQKIKDKGFSLEAILLTHGHFDHAGGVKELQDLCKKEGKDVLCYAFEAEKETLETPGLNLSSSMGFHGEIYHADVFVKDEEELSLAGFDIRVLFTPGHTPGGCCFYVPNQGICFTGDSLFCSSIGRTDFPGGSMSMLVRAVKEKILTLPKDTICYPGHDSVTTVEDELRYNPFLS